MPVIPPGIPPYKIKKPCTMGDQGIPSLSMMTDLQRVLNLIDDERHLTAHSLYTSILHRMQLYDNSNHNNNTPNDDKTTKNTIPKQKTKTFSSSFLKRSGSGIPKPPPNGTHSTNEDEAMIQTVKEIIFSSKKHIFDKLEVRSICLLTYKCLSLTTLVQ